MDGVNFYVKEGEFGAWLYGGFTKEQRVQCENSEEIESVGAEGFCAYGEKTEHDDTLHTNFIWADETKWDIIQKPARTEMKGHYPKKKMKYLLRRRH